MHVINSVEQLRAINRRLGITSLVGRIPSYQFALPDLPQSSNREASERMANYHSACGCFTGGLFMGATVLGFVVFYLASERSVSEFSMMDLMVFLALFVGSTLAGKAFGVAWARARAVQVVRRMTTLATTPGA